MEFKYRKDSRNSYIVNGEFKFGYNNQEILIDTDYKQNDWLTYKYILPKGSQPGMYSFTWFYTKYSESEVTNDMSAEIEVRI